MIVLAVNQPKLLRRHGAHQQALVHVDVARVHLRRQDRPRLGRRTRQ